MRSYPADVSGWQSVSDRPSRSGHNSTILANRPVLSSPSQQCSRLSFLRSKCLWNRNSMMYAASLRSRTISECSAGATVNTFKSLFNQHITLFISKINTTKNLYNACSPLNEDSILHGCYTPKTARCWRNRQYIPEMSVFTSQNRISSHNTSVLIYTPVTNWQLTLSLNCFNIHYDTCKNYNLLTI